VAVIRGRLDAGHLVARAAHQQSRHCGHRLVGGFRAGGDFLRRATHGDPARRWLIAGMAALWSLRLGTHLYFRVVGHHPHEDVRYAQMRASGAQI
jgi:hypothetical protein